MKTLKEFAELVKGKTCNWCGEDLPETIDAYEHKYGWDVKGFPTKQWLSVHCEKCNYDWSLWKLGVDRVSYLDDPYPKTKGEDIIDHLEKEIFAESDLIEDEHGRPVARVPSLAEYQMAKKELESK